MIINQGQKIKQLFRILLFSIPAIFLFSYVLGPGVIRSGDSDGYKSEFISHDLERLWLSITGQWARTPVLVIPNELIGNDKLIVGFQLLISCLATIYLARTLFLFFKMNIWGLYASIASTLILISPFIFSWNFHILGESLSISFTVFSVSALIRLFIYFELKTGLFFAAMSFVSIMIRPQFFILYSALFAWVFIQAMRTKKSTSKKAASFSAIAFIGLASFSGIWWNSNFAYWNSKMPREVFTSVHTMSVYSPISQIVRESVIDENRPPECTRIPTDKDDVNEVISAISSCDKAKEWSISYPTWYYKFLLHHPVILAQFIEWSLPRSIASPDVAAGVSISPSPLTEMLMGTSNSACCGGSNLTSKLNPSQFSDPLLMLLPLLTLFGLFQWNKKKKPDRAKFVFLLILSWVSLSLAIFGVISLPTTALEMARISSPLNVVFRISTFLMLLISIIEFRNLFKSKKPN